MPYKDKERQRESVRKATRKYRGGITEGKGITENVIPFGTTPGTTQKVSTLAERYPAVLYALTDPIKREKLEKIHQKLKEHNLLKEVRYGVRGPTFDIVGDLLEATT